MCVEVKGGHFIANKMKRLLRLGELKKEKKQQSVLPALRVEGEMGSEEREG